MGQHYKPEELTFTCGLGHELACSVGWYILYSYLVKIR